VRDVQDPGELLGILETAFVDEFLGHKDFLTFDNGYQNDKRLALRTSREIIRADVCSDINAPDPEPHCQRVLSALALATTNCYANPTVLPHKVVGMILFPREQFFRKVNPETSINFQCRMTPLLEKLNV
jgi:hypothetical protein